MTSALRWGWVVSTKHRPLYPRGKTRYPLYRRLGRPQGRSGRAQKISPASDRPARSESLYQLSYSGPSSIEIILLFLAWLLCWIVGFLRIFDFLFSVPVQARKYKGTVTVNLSLRMSRSPVGSGGIPPLILRLDTWCWRVVSFMAQAL